MIKIVKTEVTDSTVKVRLSNNVELEFVTSQDGRVWINSSFADILSSEERAANVFLLLYKVDK